MGRRVQCYVSVVAFGCVLPGERHRLFSNRNCLLTWAFRGPTCADPLLPASFSAAACFGSATAHSHTVTLSDLRARWARSAIPCLPPSSAPAALYVATTTADSHIVRCLIRDCLGASYAVPCPPSSLSTTCCLEAATADVEHRDMFLLVTLVRRGVPCLALHHRFWWWVAYT